MGRDGEGPGQRLGSWGERTSFTFISLSYPSWSGATGLASLHPLFTCAIPDVWRKVGLNLSPHHFSLLPNHYPPVPTVPTNTHKLPTNPPAPPSPTNTHQSPASPHHATSHFSTVTDHYPPLPRITRQEETSAHSKRTRQCVKQPHIERAIKQNNRAPAKKHTKQNIASESAPINKTSTQQVKTHQ